MIPIVTTIIHVLCAFMYNAHVYLSVYSPVLILGGYGKQRNLNKAVANFNIAAKAGLKNNVYICIIASTCTTCIRT